MPVALWIAFATAVQTAITHRGDHLALTVQISVTVAVMPLTCAKWAIDDSRGFDLLRKVSSKMWSTSPALSSLWLWSDRS